MKLRTRVREVAESQDPKLSLGRLTRMSGVASTSARRLWYNTADGREEGPPLESIHIATLIGIAKALRVSPLALLAIEEDE